MQLEARVKSTIDLLDIFFNTHSPFDIILAKYFNSNKWIGSADRRAVAEFSYSIFRSFEKLRFLTQKITGNFGRFFVLAYLKSEKHYSDKEIDEIFSGRKYAPERLSLFERNFISNFTDQFPKNAILNYPAWLEPCLRKVFDDDCFDQEMEALNRKASTDLRVNTLLTSKEEVKRILQGFEVEDMKYSENGLRILSGRISRSHEVLRNGFAEIQDEGSQLIAEVCGVSSGDVVVDYCAGAGGKTLALAAQMKNKGKIFALDKYPEKLENAKIRFRRAGVNNVFCQEITGKWLKRHQEIADIILVDAPCSGTGTWRRNPDMRARFQEKDLKELLILQSNILKSAKNLLKPGGSLIYSTCSILTEENEEQIENFLQENSNFKKCEIQLRNYKGDFLRLSPLRNGTDGFFASLLIKSN